MTLRNSPSPHSPSPRAPARRRPARRSPPAIAASLVRAVTLAVTRAIPLAATLAITWAAGPLRAEAPRAWADPERLRISYGAFCQMPSVGEAPAEDTLARKIDLIDGVPEIRWRTDVVPAAPGISFGILSAADDGRVYDPVRIELTHPPFPGTGTTRQTYLTRLGGDGPSVNAYSFDLPEEMVPGPWTFRAIHDDGLLYEVTFQVVPAGARPDIAGACDGYLGS